MQQAISLHKKLKGKLSVNSKISITNKKILSLIYTPGVGDVVKNIYKKRENVYDLTFKNNTVAVVTDGSAVLGLGNVGPEAALPVMEGKCAIFKEFAGIDAFPICLNTLESSEIINTIKNIAPVFGAINLEDISAPRCFEIEEKLQELLDIPVMHDDQHATAIIVLAGLINAVKIVGKNYKILKVVINGAGAAGSSITKLLQYYGIKNIILVDSQGIISPKRSSLEHHKKELLKITNPGNLNGDMLTACQNADILIGVSKKNLFTKEIIKKMATDPIVFALANPDPELTENKAKKWGAKVYANGRSDSQNQINNALVFPGFFKGLLKYRIKNITDEMKLKTALAIADLVKNPAPEYFVPRIFDKSLVATIVKSFNK